MSLRSTTSSGLYARLPASISKGDGAIRALVELRVPDGLPALAATSISSESIASWVGGVRGFRDATPVTAGDRFHLGSNARAMTATLAAVAVEQGRLSWQADAVAVPEGHRPHGITGE